MAWAGLREAFRWPDGRITRTYCVITVPANGLIAPIHDRMPGVLEKACQLDTKKLKDPKQIDAVNKFHELVRAVNEAKTT